MNTAIPDKIHIKLHGDSVLLENILLMLTFIMRSKNNYTIIIGPTDKKGEIDVLKNDILRKADYDMDFFPMDYASIQENFSGEIDIKAMDQDNIDKAKNAYRTFSTVYKYPDGYLKKLDRARVDAEKTIKSDIKIEASTTNPDINIRIK